MNSNSKQLTVICPAKINLSLDVLSRRADGYHNIETVMQSVSLYDRLSVSLGGTEIKITSNLSYVPRDEKNIAYKAAVSFFSHTSATYGVRIHIDKRIPVAAGLAGGSADGAGVLLALNELTGINLKAEELIKIGSQVGADIPFCLTGGAQFASGIGEVLTPLKPLKDCFIVLCKLPDSHSTKTVYELLDKSVIDRRPDTASVIKAVVNGSPEELRSSAFNVFEPVAERLTPQLCSIKRLFNNFNPLFSSLSGTGPTYYAVFGDGKSAADCRKALKKHCRDVFTVTPVSHGVMLDNC